MSVGLSREGCAERAWWQSVLFVLRNWDLQKQSSSRHAAGLDDIHQLPVAPELWKEP